MSARKMDAILLLGVELDAQDRPTDELLARADAAARACQMYPEAVVVVCGGVLPGHARALARSCFIKRRASITGFCTTAEAIPVFCV